MNEKELYDLTIDNLLMEDDAEWDAWFDSLSKEDQAKVGKFTQTVFAKPPAVKQSETA